MSDSHPTPEWLMQFFRGYFDPCPLNDDPTVDGLAIEWGDPTYCNMPYSCPEKWVDKAIQEAKKGKKIVLLTRVDPSTKWWLSLTAAGFRFAFFHRRVKFSGTGSPNFASAIWFSPAKEARDNG